eukprot:gene24689-31060_t
MGVILPQIMDLQLERKRFQSTLKRLAKLEKMKTDL